METEVDDQLRRDPLTSKPPTEEEIREEAYRISNEQDQGGSQANWLEARRRLLGERVWGNEWLRARIVARLDNKTNLLSVKKLGEGEEKLVLHIIRDRTLLLWKLNGLEDTFGEVQIVIDERLGEVHLTPKQSFDVTQIFDWD